MTQHAFFPGKAFVRQRMWRLLKAVMLVAFSCAVAAAEKPARTKTVLFLERAEPMNTDLSGFFTGMRQSLSPKGADTARLEVFYYSPYDVLNEKHRAWVREKYRAHPVDALALFEHAEGDIDFKLLEEIWPGVPVIVSGSSAGRARELVKHPGVTVVTLNFNISGTLETARRLYPSARRLVFVSLLWQPLETQRQLWRQEAEDFASRRHLEFVSVTGLPLKGLAEQLRALPTDSLVFLRDPLMRSVRSPAMRDTIEELSAAAPCPLVAMTGRRQADGPLTTVHLNYEQLGADTGERSMAVMRSGGVQDVPVTTSQALQTDYDWRQLQRWRISETLLPPGSVLLYRPPGLWESHPRIMSGLTLALTVLSGLVIMLLLLRHWRRHEEQALTRQREQFSETLRAATASRLATSLAHELNQPLTAVIANADAGRRFLAKGSSDPAQLQAILQDIADDAGRAGDVIRSVRSMVCRERNERTRLSLNDLVTGARHVLAAEAESRGCEIDEELAPDLPQAEVDAVQMQQVLVNLAVNAFDALQASAIASRRVEIHTAAEGTHAVCLSVRDFGQGLPTEGGEMLFEEFYTTKPHGMGLGLAIARSIVEAHGGTLTAVNAEGGGARFIVRLPPLKTASE